MKNVFYVFAICVGFLLFAQEAKAASNETTSNQSNVSTINAPVMGLINAADPAVAKQVKANVEAFEQTTVTKTVYADNTSGEDWLDPFNQVLRQHGITDGFVNTNLSITTKEFSSWMEKLGKPAIVANNEILHKSQVVQLLGTTISDNPFFFGIKTEDQHIYEAIYNMYMYKAMASGAAPAPYRGEDPVSKAEAMIIFYAICSQ